MVAPETVTLRSGSAVAELAPKAGARLMRWSIGGRPVLHWPEKPDWSHPAKIRGGNPLLFPLIARTFLDGEIGKWRDEHGKIRPAPMHGLVRAAPFEVAGLGEDWIAMKIVRSPGMAEAWPYPFAFTAHYVLAGDALEVAFTVENTGTDTMPYSVGNHFYFEVPAAERGEWRLEGKFASFARQEARGRIVAAPAPGGPGTLSDPDLVDLFHLRPQRHGVALRQLRDGREVVFELPPDADGGNPWYAVTTWTESPLADFYCVEPWTALPDAVHNGHGLRRLSPGGMETLRLSLKARGW